MCPSRIVTCVKASCNLGNCAPPLSYADCRYFQQDIMKCHAFFRKPGFLVPPRRGSNFLGMPTHTSGSRFSPLRLQCGLTCRRASGAGLSPLWRVSRGARFEKISNSESWHVRRLGAGNVTKRACQRMMRRSLLPRTRGAILFIFCRCALSIVLSSRERAMMLDYRPYGTRPAYAERRHGRLR